MRFVKCLNIRKAENVVDSKEETKKFYEAFYQQGYDFAKTLLQMVLCSHMIYGVRHIIR